MIKRAGVEKRQNVTQAAEALFIHRTTLFRRLNQVKELTGNGWEIVRADSEFVGSGESSYITLKTGEKEKRFYITNYSARAAKPEYCFISELDFSAYDHFSLELGGGITFGTPVDCLKACMPNNYSHNGEWKYYSFSYAYGSNGYNCSNFMISYDEDNTVRSIRIEYHAKRAFLEEFAEYFEANIVK